MMIEYNDGYYADNSKLNSLTGERFRQLFANTRFLVSNMARCFDMDKQRYIKDYKPKKGDYNLWYLGDFDETEYKDIVPIHTTVASVWVKKPATNERLVVDHIDGNKTNNQANNLRYLTYSENSNAQEVQRRKSESLKKTLAFKKEIKDLQNRIVELEKENIELKNELGKKTTTSTFGI